MKKYHVRFSEYVARPGKCIKAVVKHTDMEGNEVERSIFAKKSIVYNEGLIVSVQEISEEEYLLGIQKLKVKS